MAERESAAVTAELARKARLLCIAILLPEGGLWAGPGLLYLTSTSRLLPPGLLTPAPTSELPLRRQPL